MMERGTYEMAEIFEIVDEDNNIIGTATRAECHGNPELIHRTAHVIIIDDSNRILLQKRSQDKDIQPGKWDTAVGGHLDVGESFKDGAIRELKEELGVSTELPLKFLFDMFFHFCTVERSVLKVSGKRCAHCVSPVRLPLL